MALTNDFYKKLRTAFKKIVTENGLAGENIRIEGTVLSVEEAIGNPKRRDFPLQKGKEKLMQAEFKGFKGQAFTDMPYDYRGKLEDLITRPLNNNYDRAVFISGLNAVTSYLQQTANTIHCKNEEPEKCSLKLVKKIEQEYNNPKIAFFGLQPAMVEALADKFTLRVFDLDPQNIGTEKFGIRIESGECDIKEVEKWADLFLVTGSTVCNGSLVDFLDLKKPVIYYGTTIAGLASILGLERFCPESGN
ncbi:MAG: Rossmann-like domain-containing protein [Desulfitobacteriia bacterium]|jgi:hypothetical protein